MLDRVGERTGVVAGETVSVRTRCSLPANQVE